jgi:quinol monooxygenase YgiN
MSHTPSTSALFVIHDVADFDVWKRAFDDHLPARKAAGASGHDLHRGLDNPNRIYLYAPFADVAGARGFAESPDLARVMKDAGVVGMPAVRYLRPMSADHVPDHPGVGMIVRHEVADYAAWRRVYEEVDTLRRECGIVGHAVDQEWDRPNQVVVYHQADDRAALETFVGSDELKSAMERGGVVGPPEVHLVRHAEMIVY